MSDFSSRVRSNFATLQSTSMTQAVVNGRTSPIRRRGDDGNRRGNTTLPPSVVVALVRFESAARWFPLAVSDASLMDLKARVAELTTTGAVPASTVPLKTSDVCLCVLPATTGAERVEYRTVESLLNAAVLLPNGVGLVRVLATRAVDPAPVVVASPAPSRSTTTTTTQPTNNASAAQADVQRTAAVSSRADDESDERWSSYHRSKQSPSATVNAGSTEVEVAASSISGAKRRGETREQMTSTASFVASAAPRERETQTDLAAAAAAKAAAVPPPQQQQAVPPQPKRADAATETEPLIQPLPQDRVGDETAAGLIGQDSFRVTDAHTKSIADLRLMVMDRFCMRSPRNSGDNVEIALFDASSGKPLLLSRDVRRLAEKSADGKTIVVDAFIYSAASPVPSRHPASASKSVHFDALDDVPPAAVRDVEEAALKPAIAAAKSSGAAYPEARVEPPPSRQPAPVAPPVPVSAGINRKLQYDEDFSARTYHRPPAAAAPTSAPSLPSDEKKAKSQSPPLRSAGDANRKGAGRSPTTLQILIRHNEDRSVIAVPITVHPTLDDLVRSAIKTFLGEAAATRLVRRAVLTYFRNANGVFDARHVTMSSDAHVAGLVWEVLERQRRGDDEDVSLTLHV